MSLLLDALKKAAEQKAEKEEGPGAEVTTPSDTLVYDETQTVSELATDLSLDPGEIDSTATEQIQSTLINMDSEEATDLAEETIIENFDEDQTLALADDDVTNFFGERDPPVDSTEAAPPDDDVSLYLLDEEGATDLLPDGTRTDTLAANTEVQILADSQDTTSKLNKSDAPAANTEVQILADTQDTTSKLNKSDAPKRRDFDDPDRTVIVRADEALTEGDIEGLTNTEGLGYKDRTSTEGFGYKDQTSTRTYAPDNYDRTLVKLPDDNASDLFAGMKSESGDIMTPEHAKKVFVSKNSAQRMYNFRIYCGLGIGILLVIFILGLFEFQEKSADIDTSLLTLKRDPMPGVLSLISGETGSRMVLTETDQTLVDTQTLKLLEEAEIVNDFEVVIAQEIEVEQNPETLTIESDAGKNETNFSNKQVSPKAVALVGSTSQANAKTTSAELDGTADQQLQITTHNKISDKDQWLRQAYAAYQRGDDKTALERYTQVLNVDSSNRNSLLARAAIYIQSNNIAAAIRDYKTLLLANPKDSLAMASLMAIANYSPEVAESQLKLMIREEPGSPYLNFALANVYGAQNRWVEAQGFYFTALENNPNDPNYAYNLAVSLEHIEKPKVAIAYYERALNNFNNGLATFNRDLVDQRLEKLKKL